MSSSSDGKVNKDRAHTRTIYLQQPQLHDTFFFFLIIYSFVYIVEVVCNIRKRTSPYTYTNNINSRRELYYVPLRQ